MDQTRIIYYLARCLELAAKADSRVFPNPKVGALIVKNGKIIGEGYHQFYGGAHAEVEALKNCTEDPAGSILFCSLEPCSHTNKQTPPCTQAIVNAKIAKVIVATLDPNPLVSGSGLSFLNQQGIETQFGFLQERATILNQIFFHYITKKRPFVDLKIATSIDGSFASSSGHSKWVTGEKSRLEVHQMRAQAQAIMVGPNTFFKDNPALDVRLPGHQGPQPKKIILVQAGKIPEHPRCLDEDCIVFTLSGETSKFQKKSIECPPNSSGGFDLNFVMNQLYHQKISHLLVEAGPGLATSLLREQLADRLSVFLAPKLIGASQFQIGDLGMNSMDEAILLKNHHVRVLGDDLMIQSLIDYKQTKI